MHRENNNADTRALSLRRNFASSFVMVFALLFTFLNVAGFVPELEQKSGEDAGNLTVSSVISVANAATKESRLESAQEYTATSEVAESVTPKRVVIESVGIDVSIENPESTDIAVLDNALLKGAVRYPDSGLLNDNTNMFLFGHSSRLPVVNNKNFRAFNDLEKVKKGELIRVESDGVVNVYSVATIELVDANEALVELGGSEKKLTLSTCNSFGDPGERFVVVANFVESYPI